MANNQSIINNSLAESIKEDVYEQYKLYQERIKNTDIKFKQLKDEAKEIAKIIERVKNRNLIDGRISKLMNAMKNFEKQPSFYSQETQKDLEIIKKYFEKVQTVCKEGIKIIFEIRKFFTGQDFIIYLQQEGKIFEFSIENLDSHINSILPTYTDSLEKMIKNMHSDSKAIAPELSKLGFSLKSLDKDNEIKEILNYQDFVSKHFLDKKKEISENRKLEAAIYLYSRKPNVDFSDVSERHSLHIMLGQYTKKGGLSDTIAMYKLGDSIQKINGSFINIEIKMHNGTISLNMIANGIKRLHDAFSEETLAKQKEKLLKFFTVNNNKLSSVIEKEAQKDLIKNINKIFSSIGVS